MRQKLQSRQIIIINAAVVLLFISILVGTNLFYFNRLNDNLSSIYETHNRKLDITTQMSRIVRDRSLTMLNMHLSDDVWYIDEQYMRFHNMASEFIELRNQLAVFPLADDEKAELERCLALIKKTQPLQDSIVERIYNGSEAQVLSDIMHKDMPLEKRLWDGFNRLSRLVQVNTEQARITARQDYQRSQWIIIGVATVLAVLIMLLMFYSLRRLQRIESRLIDKADLLSWDATHDPLTNVWNRRYLEHRVTQLINETASADTRHVLIYIDLDHFKPINDTHGHMVGDQFLRAIAQCCETCIRKNDILARIGGDEFAVLLENCSRNKAGSIAECIRSSILQCTVEYQGKSIANEGCSIGIAAFSDELEDFNELLKQADHACYRAKHTGKNRIIYADDN